MQAPSQNDGLQDQRIVSEAESIEYIINKCLARCWIFGNVLYLRIGPQTITNERTNYFRER